MRLQNRKPLSIAIASIVSATLASGFALAGDYGDKPENERETMHTQEHSSQAAINPDMTPDDGWISISGSVADVERDAFELNYGDGSVTVQMDDGDRDADAYALLPGDKVRVIGVNANARDVPRILKPQVRPGHAAVRGPVYAVSVGYVAPNARLSGAHIDDVGVRLGYSYGAH